MVEKLGRLAHAGDSVEIDGHRLVVEEVEGVRITRLRLTPRQPAADLSEAAGTPEQAG